MPEHNHPDGHHKHPHPHDQDHVHPHPHAHDHSQDHGDGEHHHHHGGGVWGWISTIFHLHGHSHQHGELVTDRAFLDNQEGIRVVWWALAALTLTSILQVIIVALSGSVALLADTIHNIGDGLNW